MNLRIIWFWRTLRDAGRAWRGALGLWLASADAKLEWIARTDPRLYRAYQLKEGLRLTFQMPIDQAVEALGRRVSCARRCRIRPS